MNPIIKPIIAEQIAVPINTFPTSFIYYNNYLRNT